METHSSPVSALLPLALLIDWALEHEDSPKELVFIPLLK